MKITAVAAAHLRVPLPKPGKVRLDAPRRTGPDAVDAVVVHLDTDAGVRGLGYVPVLGPGAAVVRQLIEGELAPLLVGANPLDTDRLFAVAEYHFRHVGFVGLPARAYAAVDVALWDVKARQAGVSLAALLGSAKPAAPYFLSDPLGVGWDPDEVATFARPAVQSGAMGVRVEIGGGDVQADADRVRELHDAMGDGAWVGVSGGGRFDVNTALALAHFFEDQGIDWFEDPIPADDRPGYARLAARLEIPLVVGAAFDRREEFFRVIREGFASIVRPDVARLGGITPVLKIATAAEAYHVIVSPVRMPEVSVQLACGLRTVPHADSVNWFREVFDGVPVSEAGSFRPSAGPGLGLTLRNDAAKKFAAK